PATSLAWSTPPSPASPTHRRGAGRPAGGRGPRNSEDGALPSKWPSRWRSPTGATGGKNATGFVRGFMVGIELVVDRETKEPFPERLQVPAVTGPPAGAAWWCAAWVT